MSRQVEPEHKVLIVWQKLPLVLEPCQQRAKFSPKLLGRADSEPECLHKFDPLAEAKNSLPRQASLPKAETREFVCKEFAANGALETGGDLVFIHLK